MTEEEILAEAKRIAPWFWPENPWSVDLSCAQGQRRTIEEVRSRLTEEAKGAE